MSRAESSLYDVDGHKIVNINRKILGAWRDGHPGKPKIRELAQALSNIGICRYLI
jgi:hypothetical protein